MKESGVFKGERAVIVKAEELRIIRLLLRNEGTFDSNEVERYGWVKGEIDDKTIFGEDACNLGAAFRAAGAHRFLVSRAIDLLSAVDVLVAYSFAADREGVEDFQGPDWLEVNLNDCILFSLPLVGAVHRPGFVSHTVYVGPRSFVDIATGLASS